MTVDSKNNHRFSFSLAHKRNPVFVKFAAASLLLGLAFRLFVYNPIQYSSEVTDPSLLVQNVTFPLPANVSRVSGLSLEDESSPASENTTSQNKECDTFTGQWVPDSSGPSYTSESCQQIEAGQNCLKNGRPDVDYVYWRWKPHDCELPKFDPRRFLHLMRNKSFAFIGDSIQRNHQQSLLCTLSQVFLASLSISTNWESTTGPSYTYNCSFSNGVIVTREMDVWTYRYYHNKKKRVKNSSLDKFGETLFEFAKQNSVDEASFTTFIDHDPVQNGTGYFHVEEAVEIYHYKENRSRRWHFPSHNFTLSLILSPFLLKAAIFEDSFRVAEIQLHLDKLDTLWTEPYTNYDYLIITGGKWFLKTAIYYENNTIKGCHSCPGKNLTELGFDHAYRRALQLSFNFVTSSKHKPYVLFRTTTPDHFENGDWFTGGYCNRTVPFKEGEADLTNTDTTLRNVELREFEKAVEIGRRKGVTLKLLDPNHLSLLRPDGHPGVYLSLQSVVKGKQRKLQNDCLHWCLPGPIDSWNDLLMQMLFSG